jgi:hypothetical protein
VAVEGDRRIGRGIARMLAAAGVGHVRLGHGPPGGSDRKAALPTSARRPDLVVLAGAPQPDLTEHLIKENVPHLAAAGSEAIGVVGPLVVPGRTACLRCLDHVRSGHDPAWPLILAQTSRRRPDPPACGAVLAAMVAAQAAWQALTAIDKSPMASAAANGTLEVVLPDWRWRRRTWSPHPDCLCASHIGR